MNAVVVGGGLAGLAAAVELGDAGTAPVVVERRPALGGRAYSYLDPGTGDVVDNGQHVLFGCYTETLRFLERIGARDRLLEPAGLDVSYAAAGGERSRLRAPDLPWPMAMAWALLGLGGLNLGEKLAIARAVRAIETLPASALPALDQETVGAWLARHQQSRAARERFWEPLLIAALNESLDTVSALWMAAVVRGVLLGGREASRVLLPRVPLSELYCADATRAIEARGGRLQLGIAAVAVELDAGGRACAVRLASGERLAADAVILAVPHAELASLVPPALAAAAPFAEAASLGAAPIVSVHLWLDREPVAELFVGLLGTELQWLFNVSRIRGGEPGHLCLVASAAHALAAKGREEIEALALEELRRLFPAARDARVRRAVAVVQRRSTPSLRPGLAHLRSGPATPVANLAVAGDWSDPELPATIEAAVRSGVRAARRVTGGGKGQCAMADRAPRIPVGPDPDPPAVSRRDSGLR